MLDYLRDSFVRQYFNSSADIKFTASYAAHSLSVYLSILVTRLMPGIVIFIRLPGNDWSSFCRAEFCFATRSRVLLCCQWDKINNLLSSQATQIVAQWKYQWFVPHGAWLAGNTCWCNSSCRCRENESIVKSVKVKRGAHQPKSFCVFRFMLSLALVIEASQCSRRMRTM